MNSFEKVDTIARRLQEAMVASEKKQVDLVRETGIDKGGLSNYLKERYEPKQEIIHKLAKALNVSELWLMGYNCDKFGNALQSGQLEQENKKTPLSMKIYLSADIEGTCGICAWPETERATPFDYTPFQQQMTREVAAACRGALEAGAEEVFVKDAHDSARNIDPMQLPRRIRINRGWTGDPLSMMTGIDRETFDAVFFTGYHSNAANPGNPLSHTMNLRNNRVTLNGMPCSEFLINTYTAGYYGVPVALVTGDKALCDFAKTLIPSITTVPVNEGWGGSVTSIHPMEAVERIEAAAKEATLKAAECTVPMPETFHMEIEFIKHTMANGKRWYPGAQLVGEKTVVFDSDDWFEVLRFCRYVLSDG